MRILEGKDRLLRVLILPAGDLPRSWLDAGEASRSSSDRLSNFTKNLSRTEHGDVLIAYLTFCFRP